MSDTPRTDAAAATIPSSVNDGADELIKVSGGIEHQLAAAEKRVAERLWFDDPRIAELEAKFDRYAKFKPDLAKECGKLYTELAIAYERIVQLERGEYICKSCGLRKDSEHGKADF